MPRTLFRVVIGLAIAVGLSLTVVGTSGTASAAGPAATDTTTAAVDCSAQQERVSTLKPKLRAAKTALKKAKRKLRNAREAGDRAKVRHLKKKVRKLKRKVNRLKHRLADAKADLAACRDQITTASPVQALCDAGVPQAVCDELAGLAGGTPDSVSIDALCTQVPEAQPLCDAYAGGAPDPAELLTIVQGVLEALDLGAMGTYVQAVCDAGIPQAVCDELAELAGGAPDTLTLQALCDAVPQTQPLCDAYAGGAPDPATLQMVVIGVLTTLGLGDLLLPIPLPRQVA